MAWRCKNCKKISLPSKLSPSGICASCTIELRLRETSALATADHSQKAHEVGLPNNTQTSSYQPQKTIAEELPAMKSQKEPLGSSTHTEEYHEETESDGVLFTQSSISILINSVTDHFYVAQNYKIALESAAIIDKTSKIDILIERYDLMLKSISSIMDMCDKSINISPTIHDRFALLEGKRCYFLDRLIIKEYNKTCKRAASLKTEKGRTNAIARFFEQMQQYADCSEIINHLHLLNGEPYADDSNSEINFISAEDICNFAVVTYKDGQIISCFPQISEDLSDPVNRFIYYYAKNLVIDGIEVDINNAESIAQMPIPKFRRGELTTNLAYQLKMLAIKERRPEISVVLVPKVAELMKQSKIFWSKDDFRHLAEQLYSVSKVDEGDALIKKYKCSIEDERKQLIIDAKRRFAGTIKQCKELNTDLVEMSFHGDTCGDCSMYEGRVFSISGNSKEFPKLPEAVFKYGGIHEGCRHSFSPFIQGSSLVCSQMDAKEFSNRPFVDMRTEEQKENYERDLASRKNIELIWDITLEYYHRTEEDKKQNPISLNKYIAQKTEG